MISMENREFYTQKEIPEEEIERLKQVEYPNLVSETLLSDFDLRGKSVLDVGAGSNVKFAEFVFGKDAKYVPLDIRADILGAMKEGLEETGVPFYGVRADVKSLPFTDGEFDIVHQRFVLMNIAPNSRKQAMQEVLRVGKSNVLLLEYNWRTLTSSENPKIIERFRNSAFKIFNRFSVEPFMGEKFEELFTEVDLNLNFSLRHFKREESVANIPELILNLRGFYQTARDILKDDDLAKEFKKLIEELEKSPVKFVPPEIVAAIIKK